MSSSRLRKARIDVVLESARQDEGGQPLPAGEWFVELGPEILKVFRDADGTDHLADVNVVDFLDGLATRTIVFVSWG
jgi:hypothetical protein